MEQRTNDLPPYFKEYLEQKFGELHGKLDLFSERHDGQYKELSERMEHQEKQTTWLNQKVWMAIGALGVISVAGGIFAAYFKEMNKNQIINAVSPIQTDIQTLKNVQEKQSSDLSQLQKDLKEGLEVEIVN